MPSLKEKNVEETRYDEAEIEKGSVKKSEGGKPDPRSKLGDIHMRHLDVGGIENAIFREKWWQLWRPKDPPPAPPATLDDAPMMPLATASVLSTLTFGWITPMMILGYQRSLQATDLWQMDPTKQANTLSKKLDDSWDRRVREAKEWNKKMDAGEIKPGVWRRTMWRTKAIFARKRVGTVGERRIAMEKYWYEVGGRKRASLTWALNDVFGWHFWAGGLYKVFGDTAQLMVPLVVKAIINFGKQSLTDKSDGQPKPGIGRGVAMAVGLFLLAIVASVCQHQFFWRSMSTGVLARAALIASIYKRGVILTPKARSQLPNSALVNHISTDVSRIDACSQWFHAAWTAPIQVTLCLILLLIQLGPSALAGFSIFLLVIPLQERLMAAQLATRKKSMKWTDQRAKIISEVLGAMRVVKYFTYELPFLKRLHEVRNEELRGIRSIAYSRSFSMALAFSVPVMAATLAFVTYTSTSHAFDVAVIFAAFSLFQLLRQPLMFLPRALSGITDAQGSIVRLQKVFEAEVMADNPLVIDPTLDLAIRVKAATFEWEEATKPDEKAEGKKGKGGKGGKAGKDKGPVTVTVNVGRGESGNGTSTPATQAAPFKVQDITMDIPRGQLIAIVGTVGSGKSSILQGLIGEMRKVRGDVTFGGTVGYCPQSAWIQNATLRENILFGQPFDEKRYWSVIENSSLLPDLKVLPDGDLTEIGEKGINLSGGQKQRVNIARALYFDADIVILDDPLSAVDAHVGKSLFNDAILGALRSRGKTVVLVTHALHFLSECDYIYTVVNGRISEFGTYTELIKKGGEFARLDREFGGLQRDTDEKGGASDEVEEAEEPVEQPHIGIEEAKQKKIIDVEDIAGKGRLEGRLMVAEKRTTGSVSWGVYGDYIAAGQGYLTIPMIIFSMVLMQGCQVLNSYTLVWWQGNTFHRPNSFYQILYACLGLGQAFATMLLGVAMDWLNDYASRNLHHSAVRNVFYAPMSFFDTTPAGRILSIFGKDIDTIDNMLALSLRLFVLIFGGVIGGVVIITILEHYFIIAVFVIGFGYGYFAQFYRTSAREMKRLDSLLRSVMYSHFSESLSGLPTIRSYGELPRFLRDNHYYVDLEDRALYLTITNQRWLAIRLDFLGAIMVFIVAIFAVVGVSGINPAQIGVVLTYTTQLTQLIGFVTRQSAEVENYMNSVERIVHYSNGSLIAQEAPHEVPERKPTPKWPENGAISFNDITMAYRPGLPSVLKGISMDVKGGEKIGVVGRTGAGKSSLMLALFRIVELNSGSIHIDNVDISKIGLRDLRSKIAIIPQDPLLFSGTIRSNLDPFNLYDDAQLYDALRRSHLISPTVQDIPTGKGSLELSTEGGASTPVNRFALDTIIESEGSNLSVGERSLLSLARALVKDSKVVILDEATASVDLETDNKIQYTIQTEFSDRTLLCIAHRLRTVISYDRILVLDAGQIAEFDTPANLFLNKEGIFHGMCVRSNITLEEIEKSRFQFD